MNVFVVLLFVSWFEGTTYKYEETTIGVYDDENKAKDIASWYWDEHYLKHKKDAFTKDCWRSKVYIHTVELNKTRDIE